MCTALAFQVDTPIVLGVLKGQAISKEQGYTELYSERSRGLFSCIRMLEDVKNLLWASSTQLSANSLKMRCLYTLLGQSLRKVIEPKLQECRVLGLQNRLEHCNLSTFRKNPVIGIHVFVFFAGPKREEARCPVPRYELFGNSDTSTSFAIAKRISGLGGNSPDLIR